MGSKNLCRIRTNVWTTMGITPKNSVVPPLFNKLCFKFFHAFADLLEGRRQDFLTGPRILAFLYALISFTFQGWILYRSFCSGRTPEALVKTIKYLKFKIILVIPVCNLTLPLTLPYHMSCLTLPYLTSYLTLPYVLPYLTISYVLTWPYVLPYLTLPYLTLRLTLPFCTLPYLTSDLALP